MKRNTLRFLALILAAALVLPLLRKSALAFGSIADIAGELARQTEPCAPQWEIVAPPEKTLDLPQQEVQPPEPAPEPSGPRVYFGQLHSHTADSDGTGTPADAYAAAAEAGLNFFAVTDHSNSFDGAQLGALEQDGSAVSEIWRQGKAAAQEASSDSFLALYGFELSWQNGLGHIGTFFTPGFLSRNQLTDHSTGLETYYQALSAVPGAVGQFNHPGTFYGDFENFGHRTPEADQVMQLLEISCEGSDSFDAYLRALDAGWHIAPTISENTHGDPWDRIGGRTAVYADALTEEALAAALRNRRVYATEDRDLQIMYTLEGQLLGSVLHRASTGETVTASVSLQDPDGEPIGTVEVLTEGGAVAATREIPDSTAQIALSLSPDRAYYFLRITQPDGDTAITAPVWIEQQPGAEITAFSCDTALAVRNRPVSLRAEVRNRYREDLVVEQVIFSQGDQVLLTLTAPGTVPGLGRAVFEGEVTPDSAGLTRLQVTVRGTAAGTNVECSAMLELTFLTEDLVTTIVADYSHGSLPSLTVLEAVAAENRMVLETADVLTAGALASCDVLLIPAPEQDWTEAERDLLRSFAASGRTILLCGSADRNIPEASARLNALAQALGLTARFRDDTAFDPVNNGGRLDELFTAVYNKEDSLGAALSSLWAQKGGCSLDPGRSTWLVKGRDTTFTVDGDRDGEGCIGQTFTETAEGYDVIHTLVVPAGEAVLLVREETAFGGSVFLCGGLFPADTVLYPGGSRPWDSPNGNGQFLEYLLQLPSDTLVPVTVAEARQAADGAAVRIQGFVTAGTAVEGNRFPNQIYIQDETGGLAVTDFTEPGLSVGCPVELYLLKDRDCFRLLHWQILDGAYYNYQPKALGCKDAANYAQYADLLVSCEGRVVSRTLTEDGRGLSAFTMEDREGNRVTVLVEDSIRSASTGENALAETVTEGAWVRAVGIMYRTGGQTVLRVRNCDEITAIRETEKTYRVVRGEYTVWIRKDGKSVYMEVEGPGAEFLGIWVDGERISQSNYQATEDGNLLFRFWPRYLRTLDLGEHSVMFRFRDGEANATLVVWNHADSPYTGDPILLHCAMMILSGGLLLVKKRRR